MRAASSRRKGFFGGGAHKDHGAVFHHGKATSCGVRLKRWIFKIEEARCPAPGAAAAVAASKVFQVQPGKQRRQLLEVQ